MAITVQTITLDQWREQSGLCPGFIKIDVENHEPAVLRGAEQLLRTCRPALLIEIHSPASLDDCVAQLRALEYTLRPLPENDYYRAVLNGDRPEESAFAIHHLLAEPASTPR
jgi:hypothetical protein